MAPSASSRRDTPLALAGLGVVAVGEAGVRAAGRPARALWDSRLVRPARSLAAPGIDRLAEMAVGVVVDHALVERAVAELLRAGVLEDVADQIASSPLPAHVVQEALAERVDRVLASPELELVLDRVLQSDQLHRVVASIAQSAEVRAALTAQSFGLAEELAGEVRSRTAVADDAAERVARRLFGRPAIRRGGIATGPG